VYVFYDFLRVTGVPDQAEFKLKHNSDRYGHELVLTYQALEQRSDKVQAKLSQVLVEASFSEQIPLFNVGHLLVQERLL
jgi:hypothetical protein